MEHLVAFTWCPRYVPPFNVYMIHWAHTVSHPPNHLSTGSAVFAEFTRVTNVETDRQTDRQTDHAVVE